MQLSEVRLVRAVVPYRYKKRRGQRKSKEESSPIPFAPPTTCQIQLMIEVLGEGCIESVCRSGTADCCAALLLINICPSQNKLNCSIFYHYSTNHYQNMVMLQVNCLNHTYPVNANSQIGSVKRTRLYSTIFIHDHRHNVISLKTLIFSDGDQFFKINVAGPRSIWRSARKNYGGAIRLH